LARRALALSGNRRLCYAGGVALNSVANERLVAELELDDLYIMPSAEDCGAAIGAAYFGRHALVGRVDGPRLAVDASGRGYSAAERAAAITAVPCLQVSECANVIDEAVDRLCAGDIIGWFQEGSELGPRALGWRSILCDPRRADGKETLNARVKHREAFRPFAPAILADHAARWFDIPERFAVSPHMLRVCRFVADVQGMVPTVEHVDHTGRLQTVTAAANGLFYQLVDRFFRRTGIPIVTNTSFNLAGEPIVETPEDALWCLLATDLDAVVLVDQIVEKEASFRSLLDLRPKLRARHAQVSTSITDGALRFNAPETITLWLETPLGAFAECRPGREIGLLELCNGTRTGREIFEQLGNADEREFTLELARLRRSHVITFSR
jgi:carbamoyltransferase